MRKEVLPNGELVDLTQVASVQHEFIGAGSHCVNITTYQSVKHEVLFSGANAASGEEAKSWMAAFNTRCIAADQEQDSLLEGLGAKAAGMGSALSMVGQGALSQAQGLLGRLRGPKGPGQ